MVRLFDLICLREAEVHDLEQNMGAIAAAMAPSDLSELKSENERLHDSLAKKQRHLEALKGLVDQAHLPGPHTHLPASNVGRPTRTVAAAISPRAKALHPVMSTTLCSPRASSLGTRSPKARSPRAWATPNDPSPKAQDGPHHHQLVCPGLNKFPMANAAPGVSPRNRAALVHHEEHAAAPASHVASPGPHVAPPGTVPCRAMAPAAVAPADGVHGLQHPGTSCLRH